MSGASLSSPAQVHVRSCVRTFLEDQSRKFEPRKFSADIPSGHFTKIYTPENFPLYGISAWPAGGRRACQPYPCSGKWSIISGYILLSESLLQSCLCVRPIGPGSRCTWRSTSSQVERKHCTRTQHCCYWHLCCLVDHFHHINFGLVLNRNLLIDSSCLTYEKSFGIILRVL